MTQIKDFIGTIADDDEISVCEESSDSEDQELTVKQVKSQKILKKKNQLSNDTFGADFEFFEQDKMGVQSYMDDVIQTARTNFNAQRSTLDEKIARIRKANKNTDENEVEDLNSDGAISDAVSTDLESDPEDDKIRNKEKKKRKKKNKIIKEDEDEEDEKIEFDQEINATGLDNLNFADMNLSRPLLKALTAMEFSKPTPIQASTIPIALLARDICACAATGTGKTAAFMLPVLERLLYKPKQHHSCTRVLVLTPTRELAVQIYDVSKRLAQYTSVTVTLAAGGLNMRSQEAALRIGPDIVVATPGRLIDHLHNTPNFDLADVEILILDEADRMLDEFFAEQMKEIIRLCSRKRQTMLFSATMTEQVKDLASVALSKPVRVFVNQSTDVALNLRQEFIRIRPSREGDREAIVSALLKRTFHEHTIVFIQTKRQAHRMHILLGLLGVKVGELHGNLSQLQVCSLSREFIETRGVNVVCFDQRLDALEKFKNNEIDILLATDLAARGLDISDVKTVINFTMPNTLQHYIHRVGRTARAGKSGRAVTLVGEKERKLLKEIVKRADNAVKSRVVPQDVVNSFRGRIENLEKDLLTIERAEKEDKLLEATEKQINAADRMMKSRANDPVFNRTWFQTGKERTQEKAAHRLTDRSSLSTKNKGNKMNTIKKTTTAEDRVEFEIMKSAAFAARSSKRVCKSRRISSFKDDLEPKGPRPKKSKSNPTKSTFDSELTNTSNSALRKFRAGESYYERKKSGTNKQGKPQKANNGKSNRYRKN